MVEVALRALHDDRFRAFVDKFVVIVPVPIWPWVGVALVGIVLMAANLGACLFAAEVVEAVIEASAVVQSVAIESAMPVDGLVTRADVAHQVGGRLIHRLGEKLPDVAVGFVLNANGIAVGGAGMPSLVGLAHHLRDLSVNGADDIMRRDLCFTILEPADAARVGAFGVMNDHRAHRFGAWLPIAFGSGVPDGIRVVAFFRHGKVLC